MGLVNLDRADAPRTVRPKRRALLGGRDAGRRGAGGILAADVPNGVARIDPRAAIRAGTRVTFAVDTARLYFFDPDTGQAIG